MYNFILIIKERYTYMKVHYFNVHTYPVRYADNVYTYRSCIRENEMSESLRNTTTHLLLLLPPILV